GVEGKTVRELIVFGNTLSDKASADAYKWIIDVLKTNENFPTSSVYSDIKSKCSSAKGHTSISTFSVDSQILADLTLLYNEVPVSTELQGIRIKRQPTKVIYVEGETFSATGMEVLATYLNTYEDNSTDIEEKLVTNFTVDKMIPLNYDDTFVTISYEENGVTKTATQNITVNPIIVSKLLKSISIVTPPTKTVYKEGETFSKAGMRVNAKYEQVWSDGSHDEGEYENVAYTVDTTTPLSAQDSSITISFEDDGVTQTTQQRIIVESYIVSTTLDSIVVVSNPTKLTYIEGERFDTTGLSVDAKFLTKWSNGYEEYTIEKNVAYSVNTTSPLLVSNKSWTVSYIVNGIKKEVNIPIVVSLKVTDNKDNDDTKPTPGTLKIPTVLKVSALEVKAGKKKLTVSWKKDSSVAGYQIQISPKLNFKGAKKINLGKSRKTYTKKGLKSKKKYYVRIRAYKTYKDNGIIKKVYGKWTVKSKKIK
ncbi:MAG: fibronectin type III domain-containing protein, partial [Lachnospiraceae bacterium]|nr:fibronectin type III domain-containing protein [Lachnospiraceae bacterium]